MIRFLVERPLAVLVSFLALLILGITAATRIPVSLLPDIDIPEITVSLSAPDYAADEMEQRITAPIRSRLQQTRGLAHIESTSSEGRGTILLSFEHGTNTSLAFIEVNEKVDMAMGDLPRDAARPLVNKASISTIPAFSLNIYAKDTSLTTGTFAELSHFAREVIRRRLEQLPAVAMVDLTGMLTPQIRITPRTDYLQTLGISPARLTQALGEHKIALGNVLVKDGHYRYYLRFTGGLHQLSEISATPLRIGGRLFQLSELAEVSRAQEEEKGTFSANGHRAVHIAVIKQPAARMSDLQSGFDELLAHFREDYPDLEFRVTQDQTALLDFAINNLQQDLLLGGVLAFFLMLVFIRKWRPALLIGITIPLSLVISQLGFLLFDISINIISLGGLILGLGMIIDNSIVVIDTITRWRNECQTTADAAVSGTAEVMRPLITSVLTNCAVFIPLIFMSGLAGAIFYDQALSITVGVVSSLVVSLVLLPPLYVLIYRNVNKPEHEISSRVSITRLYEAGLKATFKHKFATFGIVALFFLCGFILFRNLDKQRLPTLSRDDFELAIDWNEPVSLQTSNQRLSALLSEAAPHLNEHQTWAGEQQYLMPGQLDQTYSQATIYLKAKDVLHAKAAADLLAAAIKHRYPTARIGFLPAKNAFDAVFADRLPPLRILLSDRNERAMPAVADIAEVHSALSSTLPDARISPIRLHDKLELKADAEKAVLYGVKGSDLYHALQTALRPQFIDHFQGAQSLVPVMLMVPQANSVSELLGDTFIPRHNQPPVRLSEFVNLHTEQEYQSITAGPSGPYYPIDIIAERPAEALPQIQRTLDVYSDKTAAKYAGSFFENRRLLGEMAVILLISVLLLYFILAAQFESLLQPLFILAELPVAVSGAVLLLYLAGNSLNLMSMIGIVIMCGLIINDSILKIDAINQLRRQGVPLTEAIREGGHKRLKPIVMISLTSIGALAPTLFMHDLGSELQQPLALALIGGMSVGMLVSLFFVPLLYWLVYRKVDRL